MPDPIVYDVVPTEDAWLVRIADDSQSEAFATRAEAIVRARELATRWRGRMRVLDAAGNVEMEYEAPRTPARS
jgi:hypothetical protein